MEKINYTDESIKHIQNLEYIKLRSTAYIQDVSIDGHYQLIKELIDNAIDELEEIQSPNGNIDIYLIHNDHSYTIAILDNGRGIPINKLKDVFTQLHTSGKFDTNSYKFSAGTFGVGATATVALSSNFRAISFRGNELGELNVTDGRDISFNKYDNFLKEKYAHGVLVLFSPNKDILIDEDKFKEYGYLSILDFIKIISLFSKFSIKFYNVINNRIDLFNADILSLVNRLNELSNSETILFNSLTFNRDKYIINHFKKYDYKYMMEYPSDPNQITNLYFNIEVYGNTKQQINHSSNKITLVNNIPFFENGNLHIKIFLNLIKKELSNKYQDANLKRFILNDYKIPISLLMNIKFKGAQFSGTIKHLFKDVNFKAPFTNALMHIFANSDFISSLHDFIKEDIIEKYNIYNNSQFIKIKSNKQLLLELNRPEKFSNCSTIDKSKTELFLAEGASAKSDKGRNSEFQAIYALGGKPFNSLMNQDNVKLSIEKLKKNEIFQDIIKLLGIIPGSNDLSNLNYNKIFITADADAHGYHITNILISNLYILCPALINEGHVYVVIPPLYGLRLRDRKNTIFIKDTFELISVLAENIYYKIFSISLRFVVNGKASMFKILSKKEFIAFTHIVFELGDLLKTVSEQVHIDPIVLEQLCALTSILNDLDKEENLQIIKEAFFADMVKYNKINNTIKISIGYNDIIIPLTGLTDIIYNTILPKMNEFHYNEIEVQLTSKLNDLYKNKTVSISFLYKLFLSLKDHFFEIERYKGLGSMSSEDRFLSCIDVNNRNDFKITNIGDVDRIFQIMGSDSKWRKEFLL